ncbi:potassium channel family protein [Syntrophothermus lipocalidus]|uniref:TrkA-N domain protein n=1 Tax=Syntrophothermus lipocalidus (strain DSM 12680 / TGB-C1) TaxID=643648 RepID=D7CMR3_SYNLT|nr:potassium channel protein [Syntrophothermus lipocalidus]ADI01998.1 TrkA-N domain protein [Syntrophothermus lipocalidus DSM 12680]
MSEARLKLITALTYLIIVIVVGVLGLMYFENWPLLTAVWATIVSLSTTGYGDIVPVTIGGRIFMMILIVAGVGVVAYSLGAIVSITIESQINRMMGRNTMEKTIRALNNHIIICGAGRVGMSVLEIIRGENIPYVLLEQNPETVARLQVEGIVAMAGDASDDEVLLRAGIQRARDIITALSQDPYNVFVTLSARALNPSLHIVARAERQETVDKLKRAGADRVITPAQLAGQRMATAMLKPASVQLVDTLFATHNIEVQIEEINVAPGSPLVNTSIRNINRDDSNVIIVAVIRGDNIIVSPRANTKIEAGDILIAMGSREDLSKLESSITTAIPE